jgi:hypothetical protein
MRLTTILSGFLVISLLSFTTAPGSASAQRWKLIGQKKVNFGVDRDVIHFGKVKDDFRKLMVKVMDGPVKMLDMKVYFDNGGVQDVQLRKLMPAGSSSRVIDLNGSVRNLSKIEFWYETAGFANGKATVYVWGR